MAKRSKKAAPKVRGSVTRAKSDGPKQPNILVFWGDDIGISNLSCYSHGLMGYHTPNIDRIAREGMMFTDSYGEQSCTAGRSSFITGQSVYRTGLSKVGLPGAPVGMSDKIVTIAALLKEQGYATGQFGKNHLGDLNHMLPTNHGFDEFFGNLYHLNAEEEPEMEDYPPEKDLPHFRNNFGPRGVLHTWATDKDDTTMMPRWGKSASRRSRTPARRPERMETCDDEFLAAAKDFIKRQDERRQAVVLRLAQHDAHARVHAHEAEEPGSSGALAIAYHDTMIDHDKHVGEMLDFSTSSASRTRPWWCTQPTTVRIPTHGRTPRRRRSAARRTQTGRARSACRSWCAGRARSRPARSPTRSSSTTTGCRHSSRWQARPMSSTN